MKNRSFYLASIILVVIALCLHCAAREQMVKGQHIKANGIEYAMKQGVGYTVDPEVKRLSDCSRLFNDFGNGFALLCLICLVVAFVRHEIGWFSVPIFLLIADLILLLTL